MNEDKLLSDEELEKMSIDEVFLHYLKVVGDGEWTLYGVPDDIIQDIKRHERLYADSVIGEDDVLTYPTYPVRLKERNELRAEQRARIK